MYRSTKKMANPNPRIIFQNGLLKKVKGKRIQFFSLNFRIYKISGIMLSIYHGMALMHFLSAEKEIKNELYDNQDQAFYLILHRFAGSSYQ